MIYSDLNKRTVYDGDWIVIDEFVINEVFDNIINTRKGQMFYGREYGNNLEDFIWELDLEDVLDDIQDSLIALKQCDGRLNVLIGETTISPDVNDEKTKYIDTVVQVQGLGATNVNVRL